MPAPNYNSSPRRWPRTAKAEDILIGEALRDHIGNKTFPCVAARASLALNHLDCLVVTHPGCPADDHRILRFLYGFVDRYRRSAAKYSSAAVIFRDLSPMTETIFDTLMWRRLQALMDLDRQQYAHDPRVSANPANAGFSFS
jgi:FPC/CPF motif-containing protein YcgG